MYAELDEFLDWGKGKRDWTLAEYLAFCDKGIKLAKQFPDEKDEIAYRIAGFGAQFNDINPALKELQNLACDLELPDHVVDVRHSSIAEKWARLEELVNSELARIKRQ